MNLFRKGCTAFAILGVSMALTQPVLAQTTLSANMTVDNEFLAYISTDPAVLGTQIGSGLDWTVVDSFSTALTPGVTNYLHIVGNNIGPSPAMFVGDFSLDTTGIFEFSNGTTSLLTDTANWMVGEFTPDMTPVSLGVNDGSNATWGQLVGIDPAAEFIWHPGGDTVLAVIFQTAIAPVETDISISVDDMPDPVLAGGGGSPNLTHTVTVTNTGNAATGVEVSLVAFNFPTGVTLDSYTESVGLFDGVTWAIGDMADGANATLTLSLTVDHTANSGDMVSATFSLSAIDQVDTDPGNDQDVVNPTTIEAATDRTVTFDTSIDFLDGDSATVTATLTCNAGLPLSQSFDISDGSPVNFTMTELPFTTPGTMCEITVDGLDGAYSLAPASCLFETDGGTLDDDNVCAFVASGNPATYTVSKVWNVTDGVTEEVVYDVDVTITCDDPILTVDGAPHNGSDTAMVTLGDGDSVVVTVDASAGTQCSATEDVQQSFVEQEASEGCTDADLAAGGSASCTFTNTAFYEGIPTLSQYGLAALILLMLGVGFVGMRRYV